MGNEAVLKIELKSDNGYSSKQELRVSTEQWKLIQLVINGKLLVMTDLEKFIDTYKQFGIDVKSNVCGDGSHEITLNGCTETCTQSDKFDGYMGFHSVLKFTKEGKFIRQGFWE